MTRTKEPGTLKKAHGEEGAEPLGIIGRRSDGTHGTRPPE